MRVGGKRYVGVVIKACLAEAWLSKASGSRFKRGGTGCRCWNGQERPIDRIVDDRESRDAASFLPPCPRRSAMSSFSISISTPQSVFPVDNASTSGIMAPLGSLFRCLSHSRGLSFLHVLMNHNLFTPSLQHASARASAETNRTQGNSRLPTSSHHFHHRARGDFPNCADNHSNSGQC
jgi:hypothetical protein